MSSDLIGTGKAFWTLPEAVSSILFGDPSQPLPSRGEAVEEIAFAAEASHLGDKYARPQMAPLHPKIRRTLDSITHAVRNPDQAVALRAGAGAQRARRHLLATAEGKLATAVQDRSLPAYGRRAPSAFVRPSVDVRYSEIAPADLIGIAAVGGVLCPPSESWLVIADRITGAALGAWFDVQISAEQILAVFPAPLVAEPPPEDAENGLDHELWLLAGAEAYRRPPVLEMMGWSRKETIEWYLGEHPKLAEWIRRHVNDGTRASPVLELRARRLRQRRSPNIPQMPHSATPATPQTETDPCATDYRLTARELVAEWLATWKLQHPRSSEAEELAAAKMHFPDTTITRDLIRDLRRPPDGGKLPTGRKCGKKATDSSF